MLDPLTAAVPYLRTVAGVLGRRWGIHPAELLSEGWVRMLAERVAIEGAADPAAAAKVAGKRAMWSYAKRERRLARRCHTLAELRALTLTGREPEPFEAVDEFDVLLRLARAKDRELLTARFVHGRTLTELATAAGVSGPAVGARLQRAVAGIFDRLHV